MEEARAMFQVEAAVEAMMNKLRAWKVNNLDNESISDGLYGYVSDMERELTREYNDIQYECGGYIF